MRYTEAKLTPLAEELFRNLQSRPIVFRPNYDATLEEPVVLPSAIPLLLLNGVSGIAVGMATNIPPHNLPEILNALIAMIDKPSLTASQIMWHIKGPDFPTGGELVITDQALNDIYETGQGKFRLRGTWGVEESKQKKKRIILRSVPYGVNKAQLVEDIGNSIVERKIPQLLDVRDEYTNDVRILLVLSLIHI